MGQRLVIEIKNGIGNLADIYYHWGAYTCSALYHTKEIIGWINEYKETGSASTDGMILFLIRKLEENGGGVLYEDLQYASDMFPKEEFKRDVHRSDGIIAISKESMRRMEAMSEGSSDIILDDETVDFYVIFSYDSVDSYIKGMEDIDENFDGEKFRKKPLPNLDCNVERFKFDEIDNVIESIESIPSNLYAFKSNGLVYELIE